MEIPEAEGEKISKLSIDLERVPEEGPMIYKVESMGEKSTHFDLPRYATHLGWIEVFGLPPYNEWVLLDKLDGLEKNFTGEINGEEYSEALEVSERGPAGTKIQLQRELDGEIEEHEVVEIEYAEAGVSGSLATFHVEHSGGEYNSLMERQVAGTADEIENLRERLTDKEENYLDEAFSKEGKPDLVVLKEAEVDGKTPQVYRKMFPFWENTVFNSSEVRTIELGYMSYGDTGTDIDDLHGRWYKLFTFEDFDYDHLEIREGNWQSTEVEFQGEEIRTKEHYEKHLYKYG